MFFFKNIHSFGKTALFLFNFIVSLFDHRIHESMKYQFKGEDVLVRINNYRRFSSLEGKNAEYYKASVPFLSFIFNYLSFLPSLYLWL